ncbi:hypothetical protein F4861DRAFT_336517 [Xylaria intraflava]|nr:hypothetical protein F4861DRAFT_336517 [Xylaria intraflava]
MAWFAPLKTAGALVLFVLRLFGRAMYFLSTVLYVLLTPPPLRWALTGVYNLVAFLLSPIRVLLGAGLGAVSLAIDLIARLKYLYIYLVCAVIIGVCAGFMLHGTSGFIFALLGISAPPERRRPRGRLDRRPLPTHQYSLDEEEDKAYNDEPSPGPSGRYLGARQDVAKIHTNDLFEERWKLLRVPERPGRRRKGLMGQIIHEESSESDLS